MYQFPSWVQKVQHYVCVEFVTGGENDYLIVFIGFFQTFDSIGPHIDPRLDNFSIRKLYVK